MTAVGIERPRVTIERSFPPAPQGATTTSHRLRHDRTYLIALADLPRILGELPADTRALEVDGARQLPHSSTYLDTLSLDSFRSITDRRFTIRVRRDPDGTELLDVTSSSPSGPTITERIPFDGDLPLSSESRAFVANTLARAGIHGVTPGEPGQLWPALRATYTRTTFLLPDGDAQLTLDTDVVFRPLHIDPSSSDGRAHSPNRETVELGAIAVLTASSPSPSAADESLRRAGYTPTAISKYVTGLILTNPGLQLDWMNDVAAP